jgi:hypothetical protein
LGPGYGDEGDRAALTGDGSFATARSGSTSSVMYSGVLVKLLGDQQTAKNTYHRIFDLIGVELAFDERDALGR